MLAKSRIFIIVLTFLSTGAYAQKTRVSGNITGLKDPNLVFMYFDSGSTKRDTVAVKNGKFTWVAETPNPQRIYISFPQRVIEFYVESGEIKITGNADALDKLKITGSKIQDEVDAFRKTYKHITDQETPLYENYNKGTKEEQIALEAKLEKLGNEIKEISNKYISSHPKSAYSVILISDRATMGDYNEVKNIYDLLDPSAQQTTTGKLIAEQLILLKRSVIGEAMLDFTQNDTEDHPVQFAAFKGQYVLVDFWASWCGPCRGENPNVLKAYDKYKDKNFTVIGVSLDNKSEKWKKAIKDDNMPWTQLSDLKGWKNEVSTYYGIQGIPSNFLVDPQGKIIAKNLRGEALNQKLAELFGG